jgi:hypothetical protein
MPKYSRGWCLYETQGFNLLEFVMKINDVWCCFRCAKPLVPIEIDAQNEVTKVGCLGCKWAVTKNNELEFL